MVSGHHVQKPYELIVILQLFKKSSPVATTIGARSIIRLIFHIQACAHGNVCTSFEAEAACAVSITCSCRFVHIVSICL